MEPPSFLANKYQIEIEETSYSHDNVEDKKRESLYILNKFANDLFQKNLFENEEGIGIESIDTTFPRTRDYVEFKIVFIEKSKGIAVFYK